MVSPYLSAQPAFASGVRRRSLTEKTDADEKEGLVALYGEAASRPYSSSRRRLRWCWFPVLCGLAWLAYRGESVHRVRVREAAERSRIGEAALFQEEHFGETAVNDVGLRHYSVQLRSRLLPIPNVNDRAYAPVRADWSTDGFLAVNGSLKPLTRTHVVSMAPWTLTLDAFKPHERVQPEDIAFAFATDVDRVKNMASLWRHFLKYGSACLIVLPLESEHRHSEVQATLAEHDLHRCQSITVDLGEYKRYEHRMLNMPRALQQRHWTTESGETLSPRWFVILDDDTQIVDMRALQRELSSWQHTEPRLLCGVTESIMNFRAFGRICYGGAGIIISEALLYEMSNAMPQCLHEYQHHFGGDGMLTNCAALSLSTSVDRLLTELPGLHQLDVLGDASGIFQSGLSFLTLHHYLSWFEIFPSWHNKNRVLAFKQLQKAADLLGGDNMFRRYAFNDGQVVLVLGYSITLYSKRLRPEELFLMERTWNTWEHEVRWASRPSWPEGLTNADEETKISYFIKEVVNKTMIYQSRLGSTITVELVQT